MKVCQKGFAIDVLSSAAGFYIGTFDPGEGPNCRLSGYFEKRAEAAKALETGWTPRNCVENQFCNQGSGCHFSETSSV